ncbi:hypothetical protein L873DRAFT_1691670 [Choiromyces venosus 120613-1]|uniref:MARVEL domain-containing protein n=1 Tax=Choiromyces venosus 120613-1 TaxID=1336337 RepID=A0A3N4JKJ0_9PEZI|nr:hypothetical protein L873DRAFT_1691670 [Choiromyces venosus 120613-1]
MVESDGAGNAHTAFRILQVLTLIPCWAILATLVDVYNKSDAVPPAGILSLFIVALLASIWSFCVLLAAMRARNTALWMTFFDFCFMAALIAGVVLLSDIVIAKCVVAPVASVIYTTEGQKVWQSSGNPDNNGVWGDNDNCSLAEAAWGLGITNIILFFITAILAAVVYKQNWDEDRVVEKVYTTRAAADPYIHRPRRHRHRYRSPRTGGYIVEERV